MKSGYNIFWTPNARKELEKTLEYLEKNFTDRELKKLAVKFSPPFANTFPVMRHFMKTVPIIE